MSTAIKPPAAVIGCLLDVSGSMRTALETGHGDGRAVERLRAVFSGVLKLVRAEQQHDPDALVFVGVFGLNTGEFNFWGLSAGMNCPPAVDLGSAVDAIVQGRKEKRSGFELLIELANQHHLAHINKYIRDKLNDDEARIVYAFLAENPDQIGEFVNAIPSEESMKYFEHGRKVGGVLGSIFNWQGASRVEDMAVENSQAMKLTRRICAAWLKNFVEFVPRPIGEVVLLLEELEAHAGFRDGNNDDGNILDTLRQYMYGSTPMSSTLVKSLAVFRGFPKTERRVLVLVSDGESTDGDPLPIALRFKQEKISIASIFLTSNTTTPLRRLYDQAQPGWDSGQKALFSMAEKITSTTHPIPVLTSIGWEIPSSGEVALYTTVRSTTALDEFCTLLLSARFGSSDALLDIMGRVRLDTYINNEHVRTRQNPSNQGSSGTCYAHATAAVIHMALLRIDGRVGGCPSIDEIRGRILGAFPDNPGGASTLVVLQQAMKWYRPLRFRQVDENGARQAVIHRRPVLSTFHLSDPGWKAFGKHFTTSSTRHRALTNNDMKSYNAPPIDGGHAVVLTGCNPQGLTFLNSWGHSWGNNGSFSISNPSVLEVNSATAPRMTFYDVYWFEEDLTASERKAYSDKVDASLLARTANHPSIFELEARCPLCKVSSPIADFKGSIRQARCPQCGMSFMPEPGHLVQALYARAGLKDVV